MHTIKKIIYTTLIVMVGITGNVSAQQSGAACSVINDTTFRNCCSTPFDADIETRCEVYKKEKEAFCEKEPLKCSTGIYGQVGTGTQPQPIFNPAGSSGTTGYQEDQKAITSCSAIKFKSLLDILIWIKCIIVAAIIPLIFSLAFVVFLWGVFRFIAASDAEKKQEGKKLIWWGIIGLFVMVSVWGIIKILGTTLGLGEPTVPLLKTEYLDQNKASR